MWAGKKKELEELRLMLAKKGRLSTTMTYMREKNERVLETAPNTRNKRVSARSQHITGGEKDGLRKPVIRGREDGSVRD